jgi:hypothetical protein
MTAPLSEIEEALRSLSPWCEQRPPGGASVLGVHLEGPYLNAERLGAQPDFARPATVDEILALHAIAPIRVVTLAPERAQNLTLIPQLVAKGIRVQLGHSDATYEQAVQALDAGAAVHVQIDEAREDQGTSPARSRLVDPVALKGLDAPFTPCDGALQESLGCEHGAVQGLLVHHIGPFNRKEEGFICKRLKEPLVLLT